MKWVGYDILGCVLQEYTWDMYIWVYWSMQIGGQKSQEGCRPLSTSIFDGLSPVLQAFYRPRSPHC